MGMSVGDSVLIIDVRLSPLWVVPFPRHRFEPYKDGKRQLKTN